MGRQIIIIIIILSQIQNNAPEPRVPPLCSLSLSLSLSLSVQRWYIVGEFSLQWIFSHWFATNGSNRGAVNCKLF